ncbi:Acetyl esterase/lipase [Ferrimonas sediminum]|uniref:Acetyl esterase/lipase n=1 Tax=Ferrimonas sediminum TaxID=718193 RepID=A0A1G8W2X1_9GAMM|nr:alpha/beta hydrolase [Ferrimonas sediminum]SDJ72447.1 Acetyl esterase/lipase [Ferrimonas sediminum]
MSSWRAKALNKVLYRAIRSRLERCNDILSMRGVIAGLDNLNAYIGSPTNLEFIDDQLNGVPCQWIVKGRPAGDKVLLYFHGGGFCFRSPKVHNAMLYHLTRTTGSRGVMVNYRLAPEFPFPAATSDCFNAYKALLDQGIAPNKIIIGGDSAGGNLALTTMLKAKEKGVAQPLAALLFSPALDLTMNTQSGFVMRNEDPFFDLGSLMLLRNSYLNGHTPCDPMASPLAADLTDLAPIMVHVGSVEILLDDSVRLASKVRRLGGEADLTIWPGLPHVFTLFYQLPEAKEAIDRCGRFIERCQQN